MDNYRQRFLAIWGDDVNTTRALEWIVNAPARREEEGLYLDFKVKSDNNPIVSDSDKKNLAKSISGFANTDGGLVVWGVYAKGEKDDPDVAKSTKPIAGLKMFVTQLNSLCGQVVTPPMPAVENRAVPSAPDSDEGYVITIVPKRGDTLVHANSKLCHGCYIRSGDGFHELHPAIIAEFYSRRPSPILNLELRFAEPNARFFEEPIDVNRYSRQGTFRQYVVVDWIAVLKNSGRGSANHVVLDLRAPESSTCSIASFEIDVKTHNTGAGYAAVVMPLPTPRFVTGTSGKIYDPLHPGQEIRVAFGELRIPFEAFEADIADFELSGFAYAADAPHFPLTSCQSGAELRSRFSDAYGELRKNAPSPSREKPKPGRPPISLE